MGFSAEMDVETLVWKNQRLMVQLKVWYGYVRMYTAYEIFKYIQIHVYQNIDYIYIYTFLSNTRYATSKLENIKWRRTCASRWPSIFNPVWMDHPPAWQWPPAPPHVVHAAVHVEAVRSPVLKVQGLAILTQQPRITTRSDHYLVHPDRGGIQALNCISSCENASFGFFLVECCG